MMLGSSRRPCKRRDLTSRRAAISTLDALRSAFREFLDKAQQAGPGSVLFVYLAGRGVQYSGDNFFVPVDAVINHDTDVPLAALRLSDYTQALAALPAKARIFVLDAARADDFAKGDHVGGRLAGGLALVDAAPDSLYALNAAPGTIAPDEPGPYGAYARALVEMMQQGLPVNEVFARAQAAGERTDPRRGRALGSVADRRAVLFLCARARRAGFAEPVVL